MRGRLNGRHAADQSVDPDFPYLYPTVEDRLEGALLHSGKEHEIRKGPGPQDPEPSRHIQCL